MIIKNSKNADSDNNAPPELKTKIKRERRRGAKIVPKDANLIPNIPHEDYFSDVTGVYYHFNKMEWRTICKHPFNNSKRWQKTFGINKYGFYEAKQRAEMKAYEITEKNQLSKILSRYNSIQDDQNLQTRYFTSIGDFSPFRELPNDNSCLYYNYNDQNSNAHLFNDRNAYTNSIKINSQPNYVLNGGRDSYQFNNQYLNNTLVPVSNINPQNNVFVGTPSGPYRLASLDGLKHFKNNNLS